MTFSTMTTEPTTSIYGGITFAEVELFHNMISGEKKSITEKGKVVAIAHKTSPVSLKVGVLTSEGNYLSRTHTHSYYSQSVMSKPDFVLFENQDDLSFQKWSECYEFTSHCHVNRPRDRATEALLTALGWKAENFPKAL